MKKEKGKEERSIVPPAVYTEDYYLTDNEGFREYEKGLDENIHPKFKRALKYAGLRAGMQVLDLGCGRGELSFYALKSGCKVTAVDYSEAAIRIAEKTMASLSEDARSRLDLRLLDATGLNGLSKSGGPEARFDVVFMVDIVEHVYPWQLQEIVSQLRLLMKPDGMLFISTPNRLYIDYFYTFKHIVSLPFTMLKMFIRLLRGKIAAKEFWPHVLRFSIHRNDALDKMHVNVMSPREIKACFPDWRVKTVCENFENSKSLMNFLASRWFGPEIIVCARPPQ